MRWRKWMGYVVCLVAVLMAVDWVAAQQAAPAQGGPPLATRTRGERDLLYVASPGSADTLNLPGVYVFDVRDNFRFIKRIPTFEYPAWQDPELVDEVKGFAIHAGTARMYLGTLTGLSAFDLITEKLVYKRDMPEGCCDRLAVSPDGKILYVPELGAIRTQRKDGWQVIEAATGKTITKIATEDTHGSHNTIYSLDGSRVFMGPLNSSYLVVADTKTHTIVQRVGPFSPPPPNIGYPPNALSSIRPFTVNGRGTLVFVNVNGLRGFEVGDVTTGKVLHRVEVQGWGPWTRQTIHGEGNASHGIAMSPDEKEIWVTDNVTNNLHVFDATVMPPRQMTSVQLPHRLGPGEVEMLAYPYWVSFGLDGKYVFASTGDVIDAATKKVIGHLLDDNGRPVRSEKMIEVLWSTAGKALRASDQFGRGMVTGAK
jgi:DNA-binding beta-propeller fold protein YncE